MRNWGGYNTTIAPDRRSPQNLTDIKRREETEAVEVSKRNEWIL